MRPWLSELFGLAWELLKLVIVLAIVVGLFHYAIVAFLWSFGG